MSEPLSLKPVLRPPRFAVQLAVLNHCLSLPASAVIRNLSSRGAFVQSDVDPRAESLDLEFSFPGQRSRYRVTGRVAWKGQKRRGLGIHFLKFHQGTEAELISDLKYWGELRKSQESPERFRRLEGPENPGCTGMISGTELQMYLTSFNDKEIDDVLNTFLKNVRS